MDAKAHIWANSALFTLLHHFKRTKVLGCWVGEGKGLSQGFSPSVRNPGTDSVLICDRICEKGPF